MAKKRKKQSKEVQEKETKIEKTSIDRSVFYFFLIIGIGLVVLLAIMLMMQNSANFKYGGMDFKKTMEGSIVFYKAKIPLYSLTGEIVQYKYLDFRNDPRKLKDIEIKSGNISFVKDSIVYVSYDPEINCDHGNLAATNLGIFLAGSGVEVKGAMNDINYTNNTALPYVNCNTNPFNTVIMVMPGNETMIKQNGVNCYEIVFNNCEILEAIEKFEITVLEQYIQNAQVK